MSEDYERRIRNLERIIIGISAIVGQSLPRDIDDALEKACEDFYYSIKTGGISAVEISFEEPPEVEK